MNNFASTVLNVIGRIMLTGIFLMSAVGNKIPKFNDVANYMASEGVPMPKVLLAGAIVFLIAGALSIALGFKARIGALLLLVFLAMATYYFHDFWTIEDPEQAQKQMISFMKNTALMGAMLMIIACGSGHGSVDNLFAKRRPTEN